jgi:hypothetical protein
LAAVRAYNPIRVDEISSSQVYTIAPNAHNGRFPKKMDAQRHSAIQHFLVEYRPA